MKFLEPTVTCILMSHMKPYLREALDAFGKQTRLHDVRMILVVVHGLIRRLSVSVKMRAIYELYNNHPNIDWYFTGE